MIPLIWFIIKVSGLRVEETAGVLLVVVRNVAGFIMIDLSFWVRGFWVLGFWDGGFWVLGFRGTGFWVTGMWSTMKFLISSIIRVSGLNVEDTGGR